MTDLAQISGRAGTMVSAERLRLVEADSGGVPWRRWGPYLSERQWGTVREDYGGDDDTWSYFSHEQARSRAYRWGEDGLAGVSDDGQRLCLALGLWNGRDLLLKERLLFGLTNAEGNHGEDVKECCYYLDAAPTASYLKMLYKYPQAEFPYADLIAVNAARGKSDPEYELLDTGAFDENRYFDVVMGNETNNERVFGSVNETPYVKEGIDCPGLFVDPGPWQFHLLVLQ